jgi:pyruvate/2-oxoglutarate/acetoin dehydrogenase E1 component
VASIRLPISIGVPELKYAEAVRAALEHEMEADDSVVLLGEEIGALGGVFTVTLGLQERFGASRVLDAPICENGLVGWAIGCAVEGMRPVVEIMFSDFSLLALDQIVNLAAKLRFMSNEQFKVPLVIRMAAGAGTNHGPQHSQSLESLFAHVPGLVVALPSTAFDAYHMLRDAIRCDDPVIFLESKALYFKESGDIESGVKLDRYQARVAREGQDITIVTAGRMCQRCLEAAEVLAAEGVSCEVLDMRYVWPLDLPLVSASLERTAKLAVVHEPVEFVGWGAEVAAWAAAHEFENLDAPITRLGARRTPIPFQLALEDEVIPTTSRIVSALRELGRY